MASDPHALAAPYALDALNDEEEREFEQHLATCEPCRSELAGLREAAAALAYGAAGPTPPPELKERILEQARGERETVVPLAPRRRRRIAPLAAAAALAAAVAIGVGVWAGTRPAEPNAFTQVLAEPGARVVPLGERGAVAVTPRGEAALALNVSRAPSGKTYEAWVIGRDGKPAPAGTFDGGEGTSVLDLDRRVPRDSIVAVTVERAGGVEQPTTHPIAATEEIS
jgi:anti-sigma-K factor RskA